MARSRHLINKKYIIEVWFSFARLQAYLSMEAAAISRTERRLRAQEYLHNSQFYCFIAATYI
jgi:hypothetical protein